MLRIMFHANSRHSMCVLCVYFPLVGIILLMSWALLILNTRSNFSELLFMWSNINTIRAPERAQWSVFVCMRKWIRVNRCVCVLLPLLNALVWIFMEPGGLRIDLWLTSTFYFHNIISIWHMIIITPFSLMHSLPTDWFFFWPPNQLHKYVWHN